MRIGLWQMFAKGDMLVGPSVDQLPLMVRDLHYCKFNS